MADVALLAIAIEDVTHLTVHFQAPVTAAGGEPPLLAATYVLSTGGPAPTVLSVTPKTPAVFSTVELALDIALLTDQFYTLTMTPWDSGVYTPPLDPAAASLTFRLPVNLNDPEVPSRLRGLTERFPMLRLIPAIMRREDLTRG